MSSKRRIAESPNITAAINHFHKAGGMLRTRDALKAGIHPRVLYQLRDSGRIDQLSRGLYRLTDARQLGHPDLVTVALKIPEGVLCLISALAWHELTTEIPHEINIAIPRGAEPPRLGYPPVRHFWFSGQAYSTGIQKQQVDGISLRVYSREKTIADCFKYRHRMGMETVLEALKAYLQQDSVDSEALLHYAKICRVRRVIQPYLEALL
ncbi:type IV toxin-antitoxin system AbiEi family antitoxin domain-containing protein [Planctomicrobium piriforme]|uniref:Transcriptional regulator, AbiEi antitoxin, Type IV TA system n=1 Tax=Planctomicrobium piriforme TaxID=1576369 RepID=A0A1I3LDQ0_9PLAN|nr:type IV toxin-antitoxin system AbiEi family antitoxin domain-containing protein [Planctomicrobium piriforme]SFI82861.1 Transcriptional regulator, AbiEi antitoxin, Type IV TA system [Planctomicrobium piriforme]